MAKRLTGRYTRRTPPEQIIKNCLCGCGTQFEPFPIPISLKNGGGYKYADYMVGHHPGPAKSQFGKVPAWNKGLKKGDHPSLARMGFQEGHEVFSDWSHVNRKLAEDADLRKRWLEAKKGQVAWNTGMNARDNPDRIKRGEAHWNWKGNPRGVLEDTHEYHMLRKDCFERDGYKCVECGGHNFKGRGSNLPLNMHHIIAQSHDRSKALDLSNVVTLCEVCHQNTENFGAKAIPGSRSNPKRQ